LPFGFWFLPRQARGRPPKSFAQKPCACLPTLAASKGSGGALKRFPEPLFKEDHMKCRCNDRFKFPQPKPVSFYVRYYLIAGLIVTGLLTLEKLPCIFRIDYPG
jgi:hypothetical protein